jgi:hypothetical protein
MIYVRQDTGEVLTKERRESVMMLTKVLYRLSIIDEEQALNIATQFHILVV